MFFDLCHTSREWKTAVNSSPSMKEIQCKKQEKTLQLVISMTQMVLL